MNIHRFWEKLEKDLTEQLKGKVELGLDIHFVAVRC